MRPFDLEAAKRGDLFFNASIDVGYLHFMAINHTGRFVACEKRTNDIVYVFEISDLRMAPRKVVKYAVIDITTGKLYTNILNNSPQNTCVQSLVCATVTWEE